VGTARPQRRSSRISSAGDTGRGSRRWRGALGRYLGLALTTVGLVLLTRHHTLWLVILMPALALAAVLHERAGIQRERDELLKAALTDPLTGLDNRRSFLNRASYEIVRHLRDRRSFALVMVDLDGFKALNDRFGHDAGDELLCDVADGLLTGLRAQDTVARLGGDEFCVLAPDTDPGGVPALARRITQAVARASAGAEVVRASVGIALFPQDGRRVDELVRAADQRLFAAKRARREPVSRRQAA
jgi:diguanylate cyclase (GGDEF)-like protein